MTTPDWFAVAIVVIDRVWRVVSGWDVSVKVEVRRRHRLK